MYLNCVCHTYSECKMLIWRSSINANACRGFCFYINGLPSHAKVMRHAPFWDSFLSGASYANAVYGTAEGSSFHKPALQQTLNTENDVQYLNLKCSFPKRDSCHLGKKSAGIESKHSCWVLTHLKTFAFKGILEDHHLRFLDSFHFSKLSKMHLRY